MARRQSGPPITKRWIGGMTITNIGTTSKRDLSDAEIHLLEAGHFALDEKNDEIARLMLAFLVKHPF